MKRIVWFSNRYKPTDEQREYLHRALPDHEIVTCSKDFLNSLQVSNEFKKLRGDEMVTLLPENWIRELCETGYRPIVSIVPKNERFQFCGFERIIEYKVVKEKLYA